MWRRGICGWVRACVRASLRPFKPVWVCARPCPPPPPVLRAGSLRSAVKRYLVRQWTKILEGRLPLQEFVFAKEVRLGSYARESSLPPAAVVASRMMIEVKALRCPARAWARLPRPAPPLPPLPNSR